MSQCVVGCFDEKGQNLYFGEKEYRNVYGPAGRKRKTIIKFIKKKVLLIIKYIVKKTKKSYQ